MIYRSVSNFLIQKSLKIIYCWTRHRLSYLSSMQVFSRLFDKFVQNVNMSPGQTNSNEITQASVKCKLSSFQIFFCLPRGYCLNTYMNGEEFVFLPFYDFAMTKLRNVTHGFYRIWFILQYIIMSDKRITCAMIICPLLVCNTCISNIPKDKVFGRGY